MDKDYNFIGELRASAVLTTSYVAGTVVDTEGKFDELLLYVSFTKGSLTTAELKVEFSPDNSTWYHEAYEPTPTAGVSTIDNYVRQLDTAGAYRFSIPVKDRYVRVSGKGTGTVTGSLLALSAAVAAS